MALDDYQKLLAPQMKGCTIVQSHHEDAVLEIAVNDYYETELHVGYTYSRLAHQNDLRLGARIFPRTFMSALKEPFA